MEIIVIIFIAILIAIPVAVTVSRETNRVWTEAARQLGLGFRPPSFMGKRVMNGELQGYRVKIDTYTQSHGKSSTTYTRFHVAFPSSLGLGLKLTPEGFFSGVAKRLGSQDIEVGDVAFDPDVMVKARDEAGVVRFLTPARRVRIRRFLTSHRGAVIHDRGLEWKTARLLRNTNTLVATARSMVSLAWFLTGDRAPDQKLERVLEARSEGRPEEALAVLGTSSDRTMDEHEELEGIQKARETDPPVERADEPATAEADAIDPPGSGPEPPAVLVPPPLPDDHVPVEERVLEAELLELAGRREEARTRYREALAEAPEDPEIQEWVADQEKATPTPPARETQARAAPTDASQALDVASVCGALFQDQATSYRTNQHFTEHYQDRTIRWSGTLRRVERYSFDMVFGSKGATRAVVEVHRIQAGAFGDRVVHTVVQLPPEAKEALRGREGQAVVVEGRLVKVDSLMRNLYVADGRVGPESG